MSSHSLDQIESWNFAPAAQRRKDSWLGNRRSSEKVAEGLQFLTAARRLDLLGDDFHLRQNWRTRGTDHKTQVSDLLGNLGYRAAWIAPAWRVRDIVDVESLIARRSRSGAKFRLEAYAKQNGRWLAHAWSELFDAVAYRASLDTEQVEDAAQFLVAAIGKVEEAGAFSEDDWGIAARYEADDPNPAIADVVEQARLRESVATEFAQTCDWHDRALRRADDEQKANQRRAITTTDPSRD